jgi:ABC-type polysaccharide transport system permease subunit
LGAVDLPHPALKESSLPGLAGGVENPVELVPNVPVQLGAHEPLCGGQHIMHIRPARAGGIEKPAFRCGHEPSIASKGNFVMVAHCPKTRLGPEIRVLEKPGGFNVYGLLWGFPVPIIFAISLCEMRGFMYRKIIQTISYLPYFMSMVIVAGLVHMLLSVDGGAVNIIFGWTAIIYISAIIGIDQQLYEAAIVDGAGTFRRIWHITIPGIISTIVIMLLLNIGSMMSSAFDLVNLLQKPITYEVSDTIATYVYRRGIANASGIPEYSFTTAIGLFQSLVNIILLTSANFLARKYTETSLF